MSNDSLTSVAGDLSKEPIPTATGLVQRSIGTFMGHAHRCRAPGKKFAPAARSFRNWPASSSYCISKKGGEMGQIQR